MTKIIMLAGAGSVGKTKALEAVKSLAQHRNMKVDVHQSTTRQTYADAGLDRESDALKNVEFNMKFQRKVMQDNAYALCQKMRNNAGLDVLVCDRSPHDYASYYTSVFSKELTLARLEERQALADEVIGELLSFSSDHEVHVFFLEYPAFWSSDTESSDGWRSDTTGKNWAWSTQCEAMLWRSTLHQEYASRFHMQTLSPFFLFGNPETRAQGILSKLFPEWFK